MLKNIRKHLSSPIFIGFLSLIVLYWLTRLSNILLLPVFADEAIYIRWAQLIIDDWQRYAFFPLNDGKTPLYIWLLIPFQYLFTDQLFAARFTTASIGFFQMVSIGWVLKKMGAENRTALFGMLLTIVLPFWFFYHRLALIDALLCLWLTLAMGMSISVTQNTAKLCKKQHQLADPFFHTLLVDSVSLFKDKRVLVQSTLLGIILGFAILTKIPAVLFFPSIFLWIFYPSSTTLLQKTKVCFVLVYSSIVALVLFLSLKLHPAFGQLFSRSSDFLFPVSELIQGAWIKTLPNFPTYIGYFVTYLTAPVLFIATYGLFSPTNKKLLHILFWGMVSFILPISIMGQVVYARYFMPVAVYATLLASLGVQTLVTTYVEADKPLWKKAVFSLVIGSFIANIFAVSGVFAFAVLTKPETASLPESDKEQYLYEWSAGYGNKEAVEFIREEMKTHSVAVATEGSFGTLPDGLLLYFHRQDVTNLYIEGIGYPVKHIPATFSERAESFTTIYLIVNSHRLEIANDKMKLVQEYCRPDDAPCLQIWDITELVKNK